MTARSAIRALEENCRGEATMRRMRGSPARCADLWPHTGLSPHLTTASGPRPRIAEAILAGSVRAAPERPVAVAKDQDETWAILHGWTSRKLADQSNAAREQAKVAAATLFVFRGF